MKVHLTRQRSRVGMVCLSLVAIWWVGSTLAFAQGRVTDVLVSVVKDKVIAVTGVGQSEIDLSVGETVTSTKAQGLDRAGDYFNEVVGIFFSASTLGGTDFGGRRACCHITGPSRILCRGHRSAFVWFSGNPRALEQ